MVVLDPFANQAGPLWTAGTTQLRSLDAKEENLIDLAADGTLPQTKIKQKLRDIEYQRRHLTERLTSTNDELSYSARLIELCLTLLENPQQLYRRCDDEQRRLLNQAIFHRLYIDHDQVTDHQLREPFARLHAIQGNRPPEHSDKPDPGTQTDQGQDCLRAGPPQRDGPATRRRIEDLLAGMDLVHCSSKPPRVELRGFEPLTP